jgi:hypothetical protein
VQLWRNFGGELAGPGRSRLDTMRLKDLFRLHFLHPEAANFDFFVQIDGCSEAWHERSPGDTALPQVSGAWWRRIWDLNP